jgi:hypothetical protein
MAVHGVTWARWAITGLVTCAMTVGGSLTGAAPAPAAQALSITVNCDAPVALDADPGDAITITMGPGCSADWQFWNINGLSGTQTAAGFLGYVATFPGDDATACDAFCSQDPADWYVFQADSLNQTITTVLAPVDGAGNPLTVGAVLAEFDNQADAGFAITYRDIASTVLTVNCDAPVTLSASPGDVVVIVMASGCSTDWQLWNINGLSSRQTAAGFLKYAPISGEAPEAECDAHCDQSPPDWYVFQAAERNLPITVVLEPQDGAGSPLSAGAVVAEVDNQRGTAYAITYRTPGIAFSRCKDLLAAYPRGISRSVKAAKRAFRAGKKRPAARPAVYRASLAALDRDRDGVMCEQRRR